MNSLTELLLLASQARGPRLATRSPVRKLIRERLAGGWVGSGVAANYIPALKKKTNISPVSTESLRAEFGTSAVCASHCQGIYNFGVADGVTPVNS